MAQHLGEWGGEGVRHKVLVHISVLRLCPFEYDIRPVFLVESHETAVQSPTFILQYSNSHLNTGITQLVYTTPRNLGEWVNASHYNPLHALAHYEVSAWRSLAIVRTGFKTHVYRSLLQQMFVLWFY